MSGRVTDELIADLSRDLRPVRPIARPAVAALCVAVGFAVSVTLPGVALRADLAAKLAEAGAFLLVALGLAGVAVGGIASALAAREPGREGVERAGRAVLAIAGAAGPLALLLGHLAGHGGAEPPLRGDAACLARGFALGALPAALACWLVARGAATRPLAAAAFSGAGAIAAGALAVHLGCGADGTRHVLLAHALAPAAAALLALPLAPLLARWRRRRA